MIPFPLQNTLRNTSRAFSRHLWNLVSHSRTPNGSFYNVIWLIFNDLIVGVAFGSFLCENHQLLAEVLRNLFEVYPELFFGVVVNLSSAEHSDRLGSMGTAVAQQLAGRTEAQHGVESILFPYVHRGCHHVGRCVLLFLLHRMTPDIWILEAFWGTEYRTYRPSYTPSEL
jgi:hypothetical protein